MPPIGHARVDSAGLTSGRSLSPSIIAGRFLQPRRWVSSAGGSSRRIFTTSSFPETTSTSRTWTFVCPKTPRSRRLPAVAREADHVIREVTDEHDRTDGAGPSLASITSFIGAGGPRFWFSVRPEPPAPNYAQLLLQFTRSEDTNRLVGPLQEALATRVPGARIDVRTVETGPPTIIPVSMRILGDEARVLREQAEKLRTILKTSPFAINVRDDWGNDAIRTRLEIDQDRAGLAGVSSRDIALSMYSGVEGAPIGHLREGRKNIPIVQLMDYGQRQTVTDLSQLYVYSSQTPVRLTLGQISRLTYSPEMAVIHRVNQYRAINVSALPAPGRLADEVTRPLMPRIREFEQQAARGLSV